MDLEALIDEQRRAHGVHTLLLYGSHARGDATPESDVDLAGFADVTRAMRDARRWRGVYLDGFVYPTAVLAAEPDVEMLRLRGCRILVDERGLAGPLVAAIDALAARGPVPLTDDDRQMRRVWAHKTLARLRRGDLEAHYRRHQLLFELLAEQFYLRDVWYPGPKTALVELARDAPATFARFAAALAPDASIDAIAALVEDVAGPLTS